MLYAHAELPEYEKILVERAVWPSGCVLRLPAVYGPGDRRHRAGEWLQRMDWQTYTIGQNYAKWRWTHSYVENVADAIALAALDVRSSGRLYNIGEAQTPAMFDRIRQFGEAFGRHGDMTIGTNDLPFDLRPRLVMDTHQIRLELGFNEVIPEREGIKRTIEWEMASENVRRPH